MARILIVDDQRSVLLTLEAVLRGEGHSVVSCTNAMDAMDVLNNEPMDLLITDAIMPGGADGYALTRTIRKEVALQKIPIILLTGKREKSDIEKAIAAGVNDYVVKPMDPALLLAKVRNLLAVEKEEEVHFVEVAVRVKAEWESRTEISSVSELGLKVTSSIPFPVGKIVRLHSNLFDEIGMPSVPLRINHCDESPSAEGAYLIEGHFVGITEKELSPLRLWIRSKKTFQK